MRGNSMTDSPESEKNLWKWGAALIGSLIGLLIGSVNIARLLFSCKDQLSCRPGLSHEIAACDLPDSFRSAGCGRRRIG
jgi:hypothetical protein